MPRQANPYRPGFNQPPGVLAGRETVLAAARELLDVAALDGRTPRPLILVGSRGVGKTVLLGEIATMAAEHHGWLTVHIEVRPGTAFTGQLIARLDAAHDLVTEAPKGRRFQIDRFAARAGLLGASAEVAATRRPPSEPEPDGDLALERSLGRLVDALSSRSSGLVISIDELQLAKRAELGGLAATLQQHVPDEWPLVVVMAGLPTIRDAHRSVTYLERSEWHELGMLDHDATVLALTGPARDAGRPLTPDAAEALAEASGGYPYAVQVLGHHAWRASDGHREITAAHVTEALPRASADLASALYAGRWADASDKEQEYLAAAAALIVERGVTSGAEVAATLGATAQELSYLRDRLLKKGTLVATGRELRFPVPGMAAWISDRLAEQGREGGR